MRELDQAPFGIVGLETLIPITVTSLIEPGHLTWPEVIRKLTINPAHAAGHPQGDAPRRRRRRRHHHRPRDPLDDRPLAVPLQEPQHPVRRLGGPRPGPHRDRRRRGPLHPRRDRPPGRSRRPGLNRDRGLMSNRSKARPSPVRALNRRRADLHFIRGDRTRTIGKDDALAHRRLQRDACGGTARPEAEPRGIPHASVGGSSMTWPTPSPDRTRRRRPSSSTPRCLPATSRSRRTYRGLRVIFAYGDEDADSRIEQILGHDSNPKTPDGRLVRPPHPPGRVAAKGTAAHRRRVPRPQGPAPRLLSRTAPPAAGD